MSRPRDTVTSGAAAVAFVLTTALFAATVWWAWAVAPDPLPGHYSGSNTIDTWTSKSTVLIPVTAIGAGALVDRGGH